MDSKRNPLHVVGPDTPRRRRPRRLTSAIDAGEREMLAVLRHKIATVIDTGTMSSYALATLTRQLRDIDRDIRTLDAAAAQKAAENHENSPQPTNWDDNAL